MNAFSKTVHPHGRGDNATTHRLRKTTSGSPPRAWGQYRRLLRRATPARFTPTGVGTIAATARCLTRRTVHPHGRGDNLRRPLARVERHGSPPRAWGQCFGAKRLQPLRRFTPTGVGTIEGKRIYRSQETVHPHGRGDNRSLFQPPITTHGSPPRAWGQCWHEHPYSDDVRFTPTGVGTIGCQDAVPHCQPVHPHGRGDNEGEAMIANIFVGSPPRAWGQC